MNTLQRTTKNGRPIINRETKLPEYNRSCHARVNRVKAELGYDNIKPNHEQLWATICLTVSLLNS